MILVTTKKGKVGKSKLKVDLEGGVSDVAYQSDKGLPMSRDEFFTITKEGLTNAGATQAQSDQVLNALGYNTTYNEDWLAHVTRQAPFTNFNFSASGGDLKTTFYTSVGYASTESPIIGSDFKRYSANINIRYRAIERFSLGVNIIGSIKTEFTN